MKISIIMHDQAKNYEWVFCQTRNNVSGIRGCYKVLFAFKQENMSHEEWAKMSGHLC